MNRTDWPNVRISAELHKRLIETQAIESGKRKKPVSLVDWANKVIESGLKALHY